MRASTRRLLIVALVLAGLVIAGWWLPLGRWIEVFTRTVEAWGLAGQVAFVVVYAVATVLFVPATFLTLAAGMVWGPLVGVAVVWPGAVLGAVGAWLAARFLLRERVAAWVEEDPRLAAVDAAVRDDGFRIVLLTRLSPVFPFNALNYALGLSDVDLVRYTVATGLGILPASFVYVYAGSTLGSLADASALDTGAGGDLLTWVGLAATVAITWYLTKVARRALEGRVRLPDDRDDAA